ncbi:DNA cytosine methyltransferase [Porphyromonas sp. HMSC077F02]|uniref:DNA cytosine methyltransferase n=1 Tax=Porphyromonas sp. HMSC077F02 TaxID=1739529 RepID=UPI000AEE2931|nr:DNA cytosine methyltransferase [Porphyromonas sp. HMSC077F02]
MWKSLFISKFVEKIGVLDMSLFRENKLFLPRVDAHFSFIDLFAGIGGFRLAMQAAGGRCVFSSEWDKDAKKTYFHNFGDMPYGDITLEATKACIPEQFDVLCGGFPCQAFSVAGYQKGFDDTRGTLFFDVAEIAKDHRPKVLLLENVKNLQTHDKGRTFAVILRTLKDLGYVVYTKVLNAMEYANVPQNRERVFIVAIDPKQLPNHSEFSFPDKEKLVATIHDCIDEETSTPNLYYTAEKMMHYHTLASEITSRDTLYQWRRRYVRENKSNVCPTLTANMGTGGHNVPLILTDMGIRKLSPKECLNFQGFPQEYQFPNDISMAAKYKQAGNSVVVPLVTKICQTISTLITSNSLSSGEKILNTCKCLP